MRSFLIAAVFAALLFPQLSLAQTTRQSAYSLSPVRITKLRDTAYLFETKQVSKPDLAEAVSTSVDEMNKAMKDGAFMPTGPVVSVFHGGGPGDNKPFALDVGFPVSDDTKAAGNLQLGRLDATLSATAIYMGPPRLLTLAYIRLYQQVIADGHVLAHDRRERYLYFEGADSANNIILIELLLEK